MTARNALSAAPDRTRLWLLGTVAVAALSTAAPAGASEAAARCAPAGARTVVANATVRVFSRPTSAGRRVYACLKRTNRTTWLRPLPSANLETVTVERFVLLRNHVGYVQRRLGFRQGAEFRVVIRDAARGRLVSSTPALIGAAPAAGDERRDGVTDLAIAPGGHAAWIVRDVSAPGTPLRVVANDVAGRRVVAEGLVDPHSLELDGETLRWTEDGVSKSAPFDAP
jgi:hypothetical protein